MKLNDECAVRDENEPEKIVDPEDSKPEGWLEDEPSYIPDPQAVKPNDWDVDIDGEWEAPLIGMKMFNSKSLDEIGCVVTTFNALKHSELKWLRFRVYSWISCYKRKVYLQLVKEVSGIFL